MIADSGSAGHGFDSRLAPAATYFSILLLLFFFVRNNTILVEMNCRSFFFHNDLNDEKDKQFIHFINTRDMHLLPQLFDCKGGSRL